MKQASRRRKAAVGGFVVLALVVLAGVTLSMGNDLRFLKDKSEFKTSFANAAGLNVGAPIKVGGVDVGSVERISIQVDGAAPRVEAVLIIYEPFNALVRDGSTVSLDTQGVLGDKYMALTPGPAGGARLPEGASVESKESNELSAVVSKSSGIVDNVNDVTAKVKEFTDGLPDPKVLGDISKDIATSAREVAKGLEQLNQPNSALSVVSTGASGRRLETTLANLEAASVSLKTTADNLRASSLSARNIVAKVEAGEGTLGALINDSSVYDDLKSLLGKANRNKAVKFMIRNTLSGEDDVPEAAPK